MKVNDVVQFNEKHKWCGSFGIIYEIKKCGNDTRYMIGVPTLHCHDFRHSGATLLKNMGMSLEDISELLHHSGTDVTSKFYIKKDTSKIKALKDKFDF